MIKKGLSWLFILIAITILGYLIFNDQDTSKTKVRAMDGRLDLSEITKEEEIVALSGEWQFIGGQFLEPTNFPDTAPIELVPGPWQGDVKYGTYQLKIKLPPHFRKIGIRVRNIWSAHKLYINDEVFASYGTLATVQAKSTPSNPVYEVYFSPPSDSLTITIQVADFYNARHGIIFPIDIGEADTLAKDVIQDVYLEKTTIVMLLIFSIFHFSLYLLRIRDKAFFYSAMYFFTLAILVCTRGERTLYREFPTITFEWYFRLQDFVTYLNAAMLFFFFVYTVSAMMKRRTAMLFVLPLILYGVGTLLLPARSLSSLQYIFFAYINFLALLLIGRLLYLIMTKSTNVPKNELVILSATMMSLFIFSLSGTFDQLFFSGRNVFNRVGLLFFLIGMNVFLAMRLINRTRDAEMYSHRLEKATIGKDSFLEVTTKELEQPLYHALNVTKTLSTQSSTVEHQLLEQQLERLLYLVSDLKDFTRIRFQDFHIDVHPVNIQMIIQHVLTMHEKKIKKTHIRLYKYTNPKLLVQADEQRVGQIVYRVLETAISHAVNGDVIITVLHLDTDVRISIEGIGPEPIQQIAADETGQSIGRAIIEQMGGTYSIDLLPNGIRFIITLPFGGYEQVLKDDEMNVTMNDQTLFNDNLPKLLIVEDDVIHAEVLQTLLQSHYSIELVHSSEEALAIIRQQKPDFLMIDEVMPGMDGIALTKNIRQYYSYIDLPVVMLVANEYPTNISLVLESGANDYIRKPATKEMLIARLSAITLTKEAMGKAIEHEMAFLQAQINPHFLYNALSSIISFCYTDGERAGHLLTMLSTYLRYILESGKEGQRATLEKELEIIRAYVEIEQARFGNKLTVVFSIEETLDVARVEIPNLLIQPLVENAIRHGIFEKDGNGTVTIEMKRQQDNLIIQVMDDGVGMTEEQVVAMNNGENKFSNGIGFTNVLRRVKEIPHATLAITSKKDEGTTMLLIQPLKELQHVENYYGRG
ncbi:histidine kinase [Lysinibacillus cavernae]|uniref:histidine kinase n=1 Tax=Lysinibacillus cavernae TaxID=2666135 RepID=UPI0012D97BF2|nr:histidine kinase [Lysinibacillus cavernae]